eukprot:10238370-Alexandrium_andersonii.AAC.1
MEHQHPAQARGEGAHIRRQRAEQAQTSGASALTERRHPAQARARSTARGWMYACARAVARVRV